MYFAVRINWADRRTWWPSSATRTRPSSRVRSCRVAASPCTAARTTSWTSTASGATSTATRVPTTRPAPSSEWYINTLYTRFYEHFYVKKRLLILCAFSGIYWWDDSRNNVAIYDDVKSDVRWIFWLIYWVYDCKTVFHNFD